MSDIPQPGEAPRGSHGSLRTRLPSPLVLLVLLLTAAGLLWVPFSSDLFWRLKSGWWILYQGEVPRLNAFSFAAPDHPWVNHEWLSDLLLFWLLDRLGLPYLELARGLLFMGCLALTSSLLRARGGLLPTMALLLGVGLTLLTAVPQEPLLAGSLLFALLLWLLERGSTRRSVLLLAIPMVMGVWASVHGSSIVGLMVLWLWAIGFLSDARRQRQGRRALFSILAALLASLASLLNPYFSGLHQLAGEELWQLFGSSPARLQAQDPWQIAIPLGGGLVGLLLLLLAGPHAQRRLYLPWMCLTPLVAVLPGYLGLWGILSAAMGMEHFQQVARRIRHERRGMFDTHHPLSQQLRWTGDRLRTLSEWEQPFARGPYMLLGGLGLCLLWPLHAPLIARPEGQLLELPVPGALPAPLLDRLGALVTRQTRIMAPIPWNNQLLWMGFPELHIFMDSRENAWPLSVVEDYDRFRSAAPGWQDVLERYEINLIVWPDVEFIPRALETQGGWRLLLREGGVCVLEREGSGFSEPSERTQVAVPAPLTPDLTPAVEPSPQPGTAAPDAVEPR